MFKVKVMFVKSLSKSAESVKSVLACKGNTVLAVTMATALGNSK